MRLERHINRQRTFSRRTFGPGERLEGVLDHIRKELVEVEQSNGKDLEEWVDVWLLVIDGMWRQGFSAVEIVEAIEAKFQKNLNRQWPDWRTADPNKAITHIKAELPPPMPVHSFQTKNGRPFKDVKTE